MTAPEFSQPRSQVARQLAQIREQLADIAVSEAHPTEQFEVIQQLAALRNQIDAMDTRAIRCVDTSGQWSADGSRSLSAWVQRTTGSTRRSASIRIGVGRVLESVPALTDVFTAGETTLEHMSVVARAADRSPGRRESLPEADPIFARLSSKCRPGQFRSAVEAWAHRVDASSASDDYVERSERSFLHVSPTIDGMVAVDGLLDPETGSALISALTATRERLRRDRERPDGHVSQPPRRSASEQNAEALRELLAALLASPEMPSGVGGVPVQIVVRASIESLRAELTDPDVDPAELVGAGPIPAATARRLACDAGILPTVMNAKSQVLDLGRTTRLIPPHLRAAVELRDQHCRWPGCDHGIQEIHHVIFWARGGLTNLANLAGICRAHHHAVHERGFRLTGDANEELTVEPPLSAGISPQIGRTRPPVPV